ncbi:hypothetical protein PIROE2DRAFT_8480 [Piromyces sp. E2]|nr:hypothetical protein PIROE2DRAFT_8480 [Piromyces sp. E2]|eukprot:OUM64711.1 hypothetical protein PIROE2DRAFT_8480 [Piromyces sp. E2]
MEQILLFSSGRNVREVDVDVIRKVDTTQLEIVSFLSNLLFPWLCLVLLLNRNDWKRPVIIILILHWFLESLNDLMKNFIYYTDMTKYMDCDFPFNHLNWYVSNVFGHVFMIGGEIIGDWYLLIRTKAIVKDKGKIKPIYVICIVYNIVKVILILIDFILTPSTFKIYKNKANIELLTYKITWWSIALLLQVISFFYDILVIIALKRSLFDKLKTFKHKSSNFLEKFKQVSELRIFISLIISLFFFPLPLLQINIYLKRMYNPEKTYDTLSFQLDNARVNLMRFVYTFMYIDQILLRFYVNKEKSNYKGKSSPSTELLIHPPSPSLSNMSSPHPNNFTERQEQLKLLNYNSNTLQRNDSRY